MSAAWHTVHSPALAGPVRYLLSAPNGPGPYPTLYLLHGRGGKAVDWAPLFGALATLPPHIAVMPDAPWNDRASFYVDSAHPDGFSVETALARDLVHHIDSTLPTVRSRRGRTVAGYSMGGAGAVRLGLAHPHTFGSIVALSPAVYLPEPPAGSSARESVAFGVPGASFDADRYRSLAYPSLLGAHPADIETSLAVAAGDAEEPHPGASAALSIAAQSSLLAERAAATQGVTATFRLYPGGHGFDVWRPALIDALASIAASVW